MSIVVLLAQHESDERVLRYVPDGKRKARRRLFLTAEAVQEYSNNSSAVNLLVGRGQIKSAFDKWTLGGRIHGDYRNGKIVKGRFICPLHPPPNDIWEIRVTEPVNQARLLGLFVETDTFLLTHLYTRRVLDEGEGWSNSMKRSEDAWKALFPNNLPFKGISIHDYVSENCDNFPIATKAPRKR